MLLRIVGIELASGILFMVGWYCWFRHFNRRKAADVLHWIEQSFHGHGRVAGMEWLTASSFCVHLRLTPAIFPRASLIVKLLPRESPLLWLLRRIREPGETVTFEADLDSPPAFDLEVHNHRWYGRTRANSRETPEWNLQPVGPFVLTTRNDWQREITTMMSALMASRECDCLMVAFHRQSPHFSVTVPLRTLSPAAEARIEIFNVLRELAAGASTARF